MKIASLFMCVTSLALVGCNMDPHPLPGMSALTVKVVAEPKIGTAPTRILAYSEPDSSSSESGPFDRVVYSDLANIVVWLENAGAATQDRPPSNPAAFDLQGKDSPSDILSVACVGQKLVFRNPGSAPVAAYCVCDGNAFNLGTIPAGGVAGATAMSPGLIEIVNESAKEPLARVYVAPTCWAKLVRSGARVAFNDVPPGHYRLVSWHPRLPGTMTEIDLFPDRTAHASIDVGVNHLPKISPN